MSNKRGFEHIIQVLGGLLIEASAGAGKVLSSDAEGNATWKAPASKKVVSEHAWVWRRAEEVAAETVDGPVIVLASGETAAALRVDYKTQAGEVTFKIQRTNAAGETSTLGSFTALTAKTTAAHETPTAVSLATGDELSIITTSPSSCKGLRVSLAIEHVA